jgi:hypothetical protein
MFETATARAAAALRKLCDARAQLTAKATAAEAELAQLRAGAGEAELTAILENIDVGPTRARAVELDMQISGLAGARTALMKRIAAAEQELRKARAEAIRIEAGKLQRAAAEHQAESDRLRAALEKHAGCPFIPKAEALRLLAAARPDIPPMASDMAVPMPASVRMQNEISALLNKAAGIEQGRVSADGVAQGTSLEELLAAVGGNALAPSENEICATFAELETRAIEAWERHITGDYALGTGPRPDERETAYVIAWVDGRVDRQHTSYENSRRVERFDPSKQKPAPRLVTREVA